MSEDEQIQPRFKPLKPRIMVSRMDLQQDLDTIVFSSDEIQYEVQRLGDEITKTFAGDELLLIGVLRGCVIFLSDLMRTLQVPVQLDFLAVDSYGQSAQSSGVVRVLKDLNEDITGRHVLLVEDIVDSGLTLNFLLGYLRARDPSSIHTTVLLDKSSRREVEVEVDFPGFEAPDRFLVGYGLDYAQNYRNLPYIASLKTDVIESGGN